MIAFVDLCGLPHGQFDVQNHWHIPRNIAVENGGCWGRWPKNEIAQSYISNHLYVSFFVPFLIVRPGVPVQFFAWCPIDTFSVALVLAGSLWSDWYLHNCTRAHLHGVKPIVNPTGTLCWLEITIYEIHIVGIYTNHRVRYWYRISRLVKSIPHMYLFLQDWVNIWIYNDSTNKKTNCVVHPGQWRVSCFDYLIYIAVQENFRGNPAPVEADLGQKNSALFLRYFAL